MESKNHKPNIHSEIYFNKGWLCNPGVQDPHAKVRAPKRPIVVAEAKLNKFVYSVNTCSAISTAQLIKCQTGLSRGSVEYSDNGEPPLS